MTRNRSIVWMCAGVLSLGIPISKSAEAGTVRRPIALTGTDGVFGPRLGAGVVFSSFASASESFATPAMNRAGESVFLASLSGSGVDDTNDQGIWVERDGQFTMLARSGDPAPGTGEGIVFSSFYRHPVMSQSGRVAFTAVVSGPGVTNFDNDGFWSEGTGTLRLLIRENTTPVPGGDGLFFSNAGLPGDPQPRMWAGLPTINAAGHVAQRVMLNIAPNTWGLFTDQSGTLEEIVRLGDPVPGIDPERTFVHVGEPGFSDDGSVMFVMMTSTPFPQLRGLWSNRSGSLGPIAMVGDPAPGTAEQYDRFSFNQSINSSNRVAFVALLTGGDGFEQGVYSEGLFGVIQPIAFTGSPAPGTNTTFFNFGFLLDTPVVSDSGITAFTATIQLAVSNRGVWSNRNGLLELVAKSGSPVPGVPGMSFSDFFALAINATGEVSFFATTSSGKAIARQTSAGTLETVASTFTPMDVFGDGTDVRLITDVVLPTVIIGEPSAAGTSGGRRSAFNDDGDIVFRLAFADGSEGVFSTGALAVPGDSDSDGDVDLRDYAFFADCLFGPGMTPNPPPPATAQQCLLAFDLDDDTDVDWADFATLQRVFTGP